MQDRDPLDDWLDIAEMAREHPRSTTESETPRVVLRRLAHALDEAQEGKPDLGRVRSRHLGRYSGVTLTEEDVAESQRLFLKLWEQGGTSASYVGSDLLDTIALSLSPATVPFWQQLLDLSRPRDRYITQRRMYALAALALLAIEREDATAYAALTAALGHRHEQVRAQAANYLARAYAVPERPAPEAIAAALTNLAMHDHAFAPRFQARMALAILELPAVHDPLDRAYLLHVKLRGDRATRTIAAAPENTLADLHYAIQHAFDWDADHLYSFFMNGKRYDEQYEIGCPELGDDWQFGAIQMMTIGPDGALVLVEGAQAGEDMPEGEEHDEDSGEADLDGGEEDGALYTTNVQLGALGLVPKHSFLYYFDFGDSHEFDVKVLALVPRDAGDYPRLVEAKGEAPRQYHSWDDDEELEADDEQ
jgi:Plasmid pRiA4b ORF-3-like protein